MAAGSGANGPSDRHLRPTGIRVFSLAVIFRGLQDGFNFLVALILITAEKIHIPLYKYIYMSYIYVYIVRF